MSSSVKNTKHFVAYQVHSSITLTQYASPLLLSCMPLFSACSARCTANCNSDSASCNFSSTSSRRGSVSLSSSLSCNDEKAGLFYRISKTNPSVLWCNIRLRQTFLKLKIYRQINSYWAQWRAICQDRLHFDFSVRSVVGTRHRTFLKKQTCKGYEI